MKSLLRSIYLIVILAITASCASSGELESNAHPYADIYDGFMTQEPRTFREPQQRPSPFFFKQCEQRFNESFYSKTSYFCNER